MYYKDDIISYLQSNNILALKLDHAITGVRHAILDQINTIGSGARRALYYTSCFTEDYYDVCENQKMRIIDLLWAYYAFYSTKILLARC